MAKKYVKLIARPDEYYDEGTEVFDYDGNRFSEDQWDLVENCSNIDERHGLNMLFVRGLRKGRPDGETSISEEFEVVRGVDFYTIYEYEKDNPSLFKMNGENNE